MTANETPRATGEAHDETETTLKIKLLNVNLERLGNFCQRCAMRRCAFFQLRISALRDFQATSNDSLRQTEIIAPSASGRCAINHRTFHNFVRNVVFFAESNRLHNFVYLLNSDLSDP